MHYICSVSFSQIYLKTATKFRFKFVCWLYFHELIFKCYFLCDTLCPKDASCKKEKSRQILPMKNNNTLHVLRYHCTDVIF